MKPIVAALLLIVGLSACASAPGVVGGPDLPLPAGVAAGVRVTDVQVEATWEVLQRYADSQGVGDPSSPQSTSETDFRWTVAGEMQAELARCATGSRPLHARVRIERLDYDGRLASLWDGKGQDRIAGIVELVDPQGGAIVGRYRISAAARSGNALTRIVSDRTDAAARALGQALCREAFRSTF